MKFAVAAVLLSPMLLPLFVLLATAGCACDLWEAASHRSHRCYAPGCLRCVRERVHGHDSPAGRYL